PDNAQPIERAVRTQRPLQAVCGLGRDRGRDGSTWQCENDCRGRWTTSLGSREHSRRRVAARGAGGCFASGCVGTDRRFWRRPGYFGSRVLGVCAAHSVNQNGEGPVVSVETGASLVPPLSLALPLFTSRSRG